MINMSFQTRSIVATSNHGDFRHTLEFSFFATAVVGSIGLQSQFCAANRTGIDHLNFKQDLEEVLYYATDDNASISGKSGDVPTWFSDEDVDQGIDVEWKDDSYHSVDEPEEIMYDVMVAQEMLKDQDEDVIPVEVVVEDKVAKETDVGGFLYTEDGNVVIPTEVYDRMLAQEILEEQTRVIKRKRVMADNEDKDIAE
nr:hypothetical protein [Tanacetum cinerariifolium]